MRTTRLLLPLLFVVLLSAGFDCDGGSDPTNDTKFCEISPTGPARILVDATARYVVDVGTSWVAPEVSVTATGPATVQFPPSAFLSGERAFRPAAVFSVPGEYTVTITVTETEGDICSSATEVRSLLVQTEEEACGGELTGTMALEVGGSGFYQANLGVGWEYFDNGDAFTVNWSVIAGPEAGASFGTGVISSAYSSVDVTFTQPGTYTLQLVVTPNVDPIFTCEALTLTINVSVTDPNAVDVQRGYFGVGVGKPDGGRLFIGSGSIQRTLARAVSPYVFVFGTDRGVEAIDLVTRQPVEEIRGVADEPDGNQVFGVAFLETNRPESAFSMAVFRSNGLAMLNWDDEFGEWFGFAQLLEFVDPVIDAIGFANGAGGFTYVDGFGSGYQVLANPTEIGWDTRQLFTPFTLTGVPQDLVRSVVASSADGAALALVSGEEDALWLWSDTGQDFEGTKIGDVGDDPRKLSVLNGIAVATSFAGDSISIFTWDGAGAAAAAATQSVGDGPVGVDLRERNGGGVFAITTGFNDATYTITEIDAAGAVVGSTTTALPAEASQPAHALWIGDPAQSFVVSCFGSDGLFVGP